MILVEVEAEAEVEATQLDEKLLLHLGTVVNTHLGHRVMVLSNNSRLLDTAVNNMGYKTCIPPVIDHNYIPKSSRTLLSYNTRPNRIVITLGRLPMTSISGMRGYMASPTTKWSKITSQMRL
jgi:hypothetical protein